MTTLTIELTRSQAESILRADDVAAFESQPGVDQELLKEIADTWPDLRAEYNIGSGRDDHYIRADRIANLSTHDWVLQVETWNGEPSAENPAPIREIYAAPEIAGLDPSAPFVTVVAQYSDLTVLFPRNVPDFLRAACLKALESSDLMHRTIDKNRLHQIRGVVLDTWCTLLVTDRVWWDASAGAWRETA